MITLEVDRAQLGVAAGALDRHSKVASDMWRTMDAIGAYIVSSTQRRFDQQTGPDGQKWIPSIRARLEGGVTLQQSGQLKASLAWIAHRDSVEVGTGKIYGAIHQLGGVIHAKNVRNLRFLIAGHWVTKPSVAIPARPYLGIDQRDQKEIEAIVVADLEAAQAGKAGGHPGAAP